MGKITELFINAVRMTMLMLLTGIFRDWSFRCMYGMRHHKKSPAKRQALPWSCDSDGTW